MGKIFFYELKKTILKAPVLILFIAFFLVNLYKQNETVQYYGTNIYLPDGMMSGIYNAYKGEITDEKIKSIASYKKEMEAIISSPDYETTDIPDDRYYCGFAYGDRGLAENVISEMKYAKEYINNIILLREKTKAAISFYEGKNEYMAREAKEVEKLYGNRHIDVYGNYETFSLFFDYEFSTFIIMIMVLFVFAPSFSKQKAIGDDKIIRSSGKAKTVFLAKHLCLYLFCLILTFIMVLCDILSLGARYGTEFIEQPIYAIKSFVYAPLDISILEGVLIAALFRFIITVFIGEIVLLVSAIQKNTGISYAVAFVAVGALIYLHGSIPISFSPFSMISMSNFFKEAVFVNVFGMPVLNIVFLPVMTVILSVIVNIICYKVACPRHTARLMRNVGGKA